MSRNILSRGEAGEQAAVMQEGSRSIARSPFSKFAVAALVAAALEGCGSDKPEEKCLTCGPADAGAKVNPEAGTGGGVDAGVAADTGTKVDAGGTDTAAEAAPKDAAADVVADAAMLKVGLKCSKGPVPGSSMSPAYSLVDGKTKSSYDPEAGKTVNGSSVVISAQIKGGMQCENTEKTGVRISYVDCKGLALSDCANYALGGGFTKTTCKEGPASVAVLSNTDCPPGVWKAGESAVLMAESPVPVITK